MCLQFASVRFHTCVVLWIVTIFFGRCINNVVFVVCESSKRGAILFRVESRANTSKKRYAVRVDGVCGSQPRLLTYVPSLQLYTFKLSSSPAVIQYSPVSLNEMDVIGLSLSGKTFATLLAVSSSLDNSTFLADAILM